MDQSKGINLEEESAVINLEDRLSRSILKTLDQHLDKFWNGLGVTVDMNDDEIANLFIREMKITLGNDFPKATEADVKRALKEAWGLGRFELQATDGKKWVSPPTPGDTLNVFWQHYNLDMGKHYTSPEQEKKFKAAVYNALESGKVDKTKKGLIQSLRETVGPVVDSPAQRDKISWMAGNFIQRTRTFGRVRAIESEQIETIEIVATLDKRTSEICKVMDGRTFTTREAVSFTEEFLSETPSPDFWDKFRNPSDKTVKGWSARPTSEILSDLPNKLPPYHPRCRTLVVVADKQVVIRQSGTRDYKKQREDPVHLEPPKPLADILNDKSLINPSLQKAEEAIQDLTYEVGVVFKDGKEYFSKKGTESILAFNDSDWKRMKGCQMTHNHPGRTPHSRYDLDRILDYGISDMRVAISGGIRYTVRINGLMDKEQLNIDYDEAEETAKKFFKDDTKVREEILKSIQLKYPKTFSFRKEII